MNRSASRNKRVAARARWSEPAVPLASSSNWPCFGADQDRARRPERELADRVRRGERIPASRRRRTWRARRARPRARQRVQASANTMSPYAAAAATARDRAPCRSTDRSRAACGSSRSPGTSDRSRSSARSPADRPCRADAGRPSTCRRARCDVPGAARHVKQVARRRGAAAVAPP